MSLPSRTESCPALSLVVNMEDLSSDDEAERVSGISAAEMQEVDALVKCLDQDKAMLQDQMPGEVPVLSMRVSWFWWLRVRMCMCVCGPALVQHKAMLPHSSDASDIALDQLPCCSPCSFTRPPCFLTESLHLACCCLASYPHWCPRYARSRSMSVCNLAHSASSPCSMLCPPNYSYRCPRCAKSRSSCMPECKRR
jgi:hypothetical protein